MHTITVRNVHRALPEGIRYLQTFGLKEDSRNGPVLVAATPVTTLYTNPTERVIFWTERDANPFFHLFESLWMLAGRNDAEYPSRFAAQLAQYSDDGITINGAYGHRWRRHFGHDQLAEAVKQLRRDKGTRRIVIQMWDAVTDLTKETKDKPCNTQIYLWERDGKLHMTVCNRSNDMVWGGYGANAVHMSVLQEWVAFAAGLQVGMYWQMSNNYHMYLKTMEPVLPLADQAASIYRPGQGCPYSAAAVTPTPLLVSGSNAERWLAECEMFIDEPEALGGREPFFRHTARPLLKAYSSFKSGPDTEASFEALRILEKDCCPGDWRTAAIEWVGRRHKKRMEREEEQKEE
jgi:hypothetical protein